jgi:hypothetical protein
MTLDSIQFQGRPICLLTSAKHMNERSAGMTGARLSGLACLSLIVAIEACSCRQGPHEEISSTRPYADLIGAEYQVIAEDLYAYGIQESRPNKTIGWITLIPGVGIAGRDIAFRRHVPKGQIVRVVSAWREPILFQTGLYYRVTLPESDFPPDIPIHLELARGNEGAGVDLNPKIYQRISRDK